MEGFLDQILFYLSEKPITVGQIIAIVTIGLVVLLFYFVGLNRLLGYSHKKEVIEDKVHRKIKRIIGFCLFLIVLISGLVIFQFDGVLYPNRHFELTFISIFRGILIIQFARLLNYFLNRIINRHYRLRLVEDGDNKKRLDQITKRNSNKIANSSVSNAILVFAIYLLLQNFAFDPALLEFNQNDANPFILKISTILIVLIVLSLGRVLIWVLTQLVLFRYYHKNKINIGTQFAINQLISYFIYVVTILTALHQLDIKMTVVWGGLAALLVGVGLGLQQTFNDLFSGILLLFERGIEIGEVIEIDGTVGYVKKIGLRTSIIESRDNITMIVPNSKLVTNNVINWSHYDDKVRFKIAVGVAYGSDTALVKKILLETAKENSFILKFPSPNVRFLDFGSSALDFELLFFSKNFVIIEDVKSDIRFEIDRKFREADISIPFPQRDIWIRK